MADERQASLKLFANVDEATIQRSIKRLRELHSAEKDVVSTNKQVGTSSKQVASDVLPLASVQKRLIDNLKQRIDLGRKEIQLSQEQSRALKQEAAARENVARAAKAQSGADVSRKQFTAVAGATSALGGIESLAGGGPAGDILRAVSAVARLKTQIDAFSAASDTAGASAGKASGGMSALGGSLSSLVAGGVAALAIAALSIAIQKFIEDLNKHQQVLAATTDAQVKYHELLIAGSDEEIQSGLRSLEVKRQAVAATLAEVSAGQKAAESVGGFEAAVAKLLYTLGFTTKKEETRLNEQIQSLDIEINAYRRAAQERGVSTQSVEQSTNALKAATEAEKKRNAAIEEAKRKEEERARAIKQAAQDIAQARMREAQAEAEAAQKRTDKLADIARGFAQASADALRDLQQDQAAMVEKLGQEQADILLESQRDEERAAREHVRAIKSIRDKAAVDEFNATRDRDFARLVEIRRGVEQEVDETSERFAAERQEANIALRDRLRDAVVAYHRERAARLQDYNNQLNDLRINRQRQQQEARIAYSRELANLRQRLQDEINLKNAALQSTLSATRAWAEAMRRAVGGQSGTTSGGGSSGTWSQNPFLRRASGGPLAAGQTALVNELGNESFVSSGRAMMLPNGLGMFMPLRSGTVNPSRGAMSVNMAVYAAPGMSEAKVAKIAVGLIHQKFKDLFA